MYHIMICVLEASRRSMLCLCKSKTYSGGLGR